MNTSLESKTLSLIQNRSRMLSQVRAFFAKKNILEVDCPLLSLNAPIDAHIDVMHVTASGETAYLQTSPEYPMKRLLSEARQDIYQLSHVFRSGEKGSLHNPEFTMIEWYRFDLTYNSFIQEVIELIRLFLKDLPTTITTYQNLFLSHVAFDPFQATDEELIHFLQDRIQGLDLKTLDKDDLLQLTMSHFIEPHLGNDSLQIITDYPPSQAALATVETIEGVEFARRFEIYHRGLELANGYHELTDAHILRKRLSNANQLRQKLGKAPLPLDENLLAAMEKGLPPCHGVAVGFDRLLMLQLGAKSLDEVIYFPWPNA